MAKALVVFWSGTGNTEIMAEKVAEGLKKGKADVTLKHVSEIDPSDVKKYDLIALGCPAMGDEALEEDEFLPFFEEASENISGKKVALFGSYDWGDGQWMRDWEDEVKDAGAKLFKEGLIINNTPDSDGEDECVEFGKKFASF